MSTIKSAVFILALCAFSSAAFAYDSFVSTISRVYPVSDTTNGDFIITLSSDVGTTCTNASSPKYYYVFIGQSGVSQGSSSKIYAAALAAALANRPVRVWFDSSAPQCWVNALWVDF